MSPSCAATIFEGDNGGATAPGVTETEIIVAVPHVAANRQAIVAALFDYFNLRFELYGRRLRPVFPAGTSADPTTARALAAEVAGQGAFASLAGIAEWASFPQKALFQELARDGIISIARGDGQFLSDRTVFDALHPFVWSTYTSSEVLLGNVAEVTCTALAGRLATRAGDVGFRTKERKFAILARGRHSAPGVGPLRDGLDACGVRPTIASSIASSDPTSTELTNTLRGLKAQGVTTLICVCEANYGYTSMSTSATGADYRPEWVLTSMDSSVTESSIQTAVSQNGAGAPFGVFERPKLLPYQVQPWFGALQQTASQMLSGDPANFRSNVIGTGEALYDQLLVLATGIQSAGPTLTPDTFGQGLMAAVFPNPGAGQEPFWQPSAGFGPGDHSLYGDFALAWWNPDPGLAPVDARSQPGRGSWCYVAQGARYRAGRYPANAGDRLFNPAEACR